MKELNKIYRVWKGDVEIVQYPLFHATFWGFPEEEK
jgi:hypothetical protein